jgi:uncharacterized protein YndB with AHSA1/START domain
MDATLETNASGYNYALIIECRFDYPPEKVWRAITERELLKQWFPCDVVGNWSVGAKLDFVFSPEQAADVSDEDLHGEVLAVDEPLLLEFRWGTHSMKFELKPDGDGCLFRLSERFDDKSWCARNAAGWEMCIENLDLILEGAGIAKFAAEVWREKFDRYAQKFKDIIGPRGGLAEDDPLLKLGREEKSAQ